MIRFRTILAVSSAACALAVASFGAPLAQSFAGRAQQNASQPAAAPLDSIMARIDQAAANFKGLTAEIRKVSHTDVVNIDAVDTGTMMVKRIKPHDTRFRIELTNPKQTVTIGGGKVQVFYPLTNEAKEVDLGKNRGVVEQFMLLGFGSNSAELKSAYTVTLGGPETVNGEKATRIVLIPKDPEVLAQLKKCELWVSDKGLTLQQKFHTGGGDYLMSTYSHMNWNPTIADKDLKLELPKGVKIGKLK